MSGRTYLETKEPLCPDGRNVQNPKVNKFFAHTPAVSGHSVNEESTSVQIECEQVTAVAEQSETNTFVVSYLAESAVTE